MKCWQGGRKALSSPHPTHTPSRGSQRHPGSPRGALLGLRSPPIEAIGFEGNSPELTRGEVNGGITGRVIDPVCSDTPKTPGVGQPLLRSLFGVYFQFKVIVFPENNPCLWPTQIWRVPKASDMTPQGQGSASARLGASSLWLCPHAQGISLNPMPTPRVPEQPCNVSSALKR